MENSFWINNKNCKPVKHFVTEKIEPGICEDDEDLKDDEEQHQEHVDPERRVIAG